MKNQGIPKKQTTVANPSVGDKVHTAFANPDVPELYNTSQEVSPTRKHDPRLDHITMTLSESGNVDAIMETIFDSIYKTMTANKNVEEKNENNRKNS